MSSSEEFSSPDVVEGASPSYAPTTLRRQNADVAPDHMKLSGANHGVQRAIKACRLQSLGFGRTDRKTDFQFQDPPRSATAPHVEWTKFFSDVWNTRRNNDATCECERLDIPSDASGDESGVLVECAAKSGPLPSACPALGTASIERKYTSPTFKSQHNSLLVTKLRITTSDIEAVTPETVSGTKKTPDYVDPRLILRRKMMMRPSLAKKLAETNAKNAEEEVMQKKLDHEKLAAAAAAKVFRNMQILSVRRRMMMRPSKVKQIAELESNLRTLQTAIDNIKFEKMALVEAAKKSENARRLAIRRQLMQRPSKAVHTPNPDSNIIMKKPQALQFVHSDSFTHVPKESAIFDSGLDELLEQFSIGFKNGIFKADALVTQLQPGKSRGLFQSPKRGIISQCNMVTHVPSV